MSTDSNILAINNPGDRNSALVWYRLHCEREDICEALLKESAPGAEPQAGAQRMSNEDARQAANWRRELLQARLRKTEHALDRLMSGSYGACCKCGRWIEDTKLNFDPAIAFCTECWERMQTKQLAIRKASSRSAVSSNSAVSDQTHRA